MELKTRCKYRIDLYDSSHTQSENIPVGTDSSCRNLQIILGSRKILHLIRILSKVYVHFPHTPYFLHWLRVGCECSCSRWNSKKSCLLEIPADLKAKGNQFLQSKPPQKRRAIYAEKRSPYSLHKEPACPTCSNSYIVDNKVNRKSKKGTKIGNSNKQEN